MKLNRMLSATAAFVVGMSAMGQDNVVSVETRKLGSEVQPTMYGVFFEDINYAADGGLYAELVKNRSFEFYPDHFMGWKMFGNVTLKDDGPFERNPHYVRLSGSGHSDKWTGIQNEGFFGIGLKKDADYRFSVWARVPDGQPVNLLVQFIDQHSRGERQQFAEQVLKVDSREWKKYEVVIRSGLTIDKANLRIFLTDGNRRTGGNSTVDLEHVSLFPVDTWMGHENGMRKDLAQALYDMKPGVFRFPGGCIVEGTEIADRYQWKNTVGPVENRPLNKNRWEYTFNYRFYPDYFQSYGLGFYEYFLLSEEVGAEPLPVLNVGMVCQYQNWDREAAHVPCTEADLKPYIDDCLDLIEFANGGTDTPWGKVRAEMGHPAPFNMKLLAIGNEQWGEFYFKRLKPFVEAVRKAHPEIKIIGTSGPDSEGKNFDLGWEAMKEQKADLVDEHFYRPIDWFKNSMNRYDDYDRKGPKVFAGEYACHDRGKKWNHAGASIYEAAFMTTLERNADVVHMATYAPLFAHVDGWQWRPDMIWFDNLRSARTASYYVQQMYAMNKGTHVLPVSLSVPTPKGEDGLFASAVWDKDTQEYIVKVINTTDRAQRVRIELKDAKKLSATARTITLDCSDYELDNTPDNPNAVMPAEGFVAVGNGVIDTSVKGKTFVVYRVRK
ncbi:MAG: carbohydrate binding domain-containing protein [Clostridium sp.]|nr:carbohydrate binding domain-containing protein [Clostridium sp.]